MSVVTAGEFASPLAAFTLPLSAVLRPPGCFNERRLQRSALAEAALAGDVACWRRSRSLVLGFLHGIVEAACVLDRRVSFDRRIARGAWAALLVAWIYEYTA
jgi:hypothetical protein